ncbi:hypothetical protein DSCO28_13150 [Desulfosarcina ovata subsp. sediminis]|uniref:4Fe-4S ferredoxin-type domain-containing protein n=1 Tax=Desulfosarcina ovata subsp. sediminis TaxID=885957 RepID=A0A5K7ZM52_9BACT|nr:hypothetical protein [Desulfosarcina ovata]BBO80749.1 hypothetical protein DSCO28_13150 [Desulfosarcina ovata subsp. sediminis]
MNGDCYRVTYINSDKEEKVEFIKVLGDCAKFEIDNIVKVERAFIRVFEEVEKSVVRSRIEARTQLDKKDGRDEDKNFSKNVGVCGLCYASNCPHNCFK